MANASDSNGQHSFTVETIPAASFTRLEPGMDPPSYEEAVNLFIAPPSYDSLFGRAIQARKSSKGVLDFFKSLLILVLGTIGYTMVLTGTVVIPVAMILMGSLYMYQCPQGENIPVFLLVGGLLGVFKQFLNLSESVKKTAEEAEAERVKHQPTHNLLHWFIIVWFILGSYWVYELFEPNFDPIAGPYCNKTLYLFAYWLITSANIFFALIICGVCFLAISSCVPHRFVSGIEGQNRSSSAS